VFDYSPIGNYKVAELQTKISSVTIFRDGARVSRTGKIHLAKGSHKVAIQKITDFAQTDSFRVKGKGSAKLSSINVQLVSEIFEPNIDVKPLHDENKQLQDQLNETQDELQFHNSRLANIANMTLEFSNNFGLVYAANEGDISQLAEMDRKSSRLALDTRKTIRDLEDKIQEITKRIDVIRANIGRIGSECRTENTHTIEVSLDVAEEADIELEIMYQTQNAHWYPTYDVDLNINKSKLRRMALILNQTKEDWKDVSLTVSTATAKPAQAIEGAPYYIGVYNPEIEREHKESVRASGMGGMPAAAPRFASAMAPPAPPPEIEEEFAESSETISGITIYELPKKVTIPSDNEKHPVTLIEEELSSTTVYYWYAEEMTEVVALDEVTNGDNVMLPGKVKVYASGDYIGETSMAQISPREKFKIGTRIALDVKAEKKLVVREVEKAGVMRGKLRRGYKYRLEIQSFSNHPIEIDIVDRIPHSLNPSIEVKADWEKISAKSQKLGVIEWHRTIQPNQTVKIEYEYEVIWDKEITIHPPLP
jgi:uncharacterized protein (TIGR02231 family)